MEIICNNIEDYSKRFWSKVEIRDEDQCWEWQYGKQGKGYGSVGIGAGKTALAHRVAYQLVNGEFPNELCTLHKCDNRNCVNPSHLFLGTIQDNNRDMVLKGRNKLPAPKLDMDKVKRMRELFTSGNISYCKIAEEFNITRGWAKKVIKGDYWRLPLAE